MADFSDVVEQLQRNNRSEAGRDSRHTAMLNQLNETMKTIEATGTRQEEKEEVTNAIIEDLKRQVQEEKKILQDNGKLVQGSNKLNKLMLRQSEEELKEKVRQADTPSERKEAEKELKSFQDKQVGRLGAIVDGFKGIGLAWKAIGIGAVISALQFLADKFSANQKVMDTMNTISVATGEILVRLSNIFIDLGEKAQNV